MRPRRSAAKSAEEPWYSRGYVPHFDEPGKVQSLTFHLFDAMPVEVVKQWKLELKIYEGLPQSDPRHVELRRRIAVYGDKGYGECWLRQPAHAAIVENAFWHFDGDRYHLLAWCVMPNHAHVLIDTVKKWTLGQVIHYWKSFTAKEINKLLRRNGVFWERDYHDRYVRNEEHLRNVTQYIEENPVTAGMVSKASDWKFSSATHR